ncbi:MAG: S1 RNA-binding domain-containing protein [Chloroflexota bacterium]|nr:S1 RNA-binding domain-containing protein [Anaerolineales bacterium]
MTQRSAPYEARDPSHDDNDFWSALFAQEETLSSHDTQHATDEHWEPLPPPDNKPTPPQSTAPIEEKNPWQLAQEYMDADEVIRLRVVSYNKGGLIVYWHGLQGFVPASQLIDFPQFHIEQQRIRALQQWVHRWLTLKIIEVNTQSNRLIMSERASQVSAEDRDQLLYNIAPGDKLTGTVSNLTDFGAFLDLGGIEGLIHISELSWSRVTHPSKVLRPGQQTDVIVLEVDRNNGRVALSRKRLKNDPWHQIEDRYQPGQIVEGVVSNVVSFGAFVQLEDELEGLVHISELAEGNFLHPRNVVSRGEQVRARVLAVSGKEKRLSLSLRVMANGHNPEGD